ncbi:Long-chain-fatty-acid-CoA ligase [Dehalogenimonas sp. WBC-2]|nr:Long-chain-fatty-acid-CoA ligase [Dehalogenimonas sp. WBC-2]
MSNGLANSLINLGIKTGDKVAMLLENTPDFVIIYFGVIKAGAIAIPLDTKYKLLEIKAVLNDCLPKALIAEASILKTLGSELPQFASLVNVISMGDGTSEYNSYISLLNAAEVAPQINKYPELAHIAYTSGPTLRPHGAEITQVGLIKAAEGSAAGFGQSELDTVVLFALPLHHTMGIAIIMMTALYAGSRVVMLNGISMDALLCAIEKERATMFHGVPFIHAMVVNHIKTNGLKYNISSLRFCGSAGAPIPISVITDFEYLTGKHLVQYYGLTESTTHVTCQDVTKTGISGGVGTAISGFEILIVNEDGGSMAAGEPGEVIIRGPIMQAYHNRKEDTAKYIRDGWLYTDDIGVIDEKGELFIKGVKKPMLITKGQNIYFSDISDVLITHPLVEDAAATGISDPDEMRGEVVLAVVKLKESATMTEQEVKKFCLDRLANYKCPKKVLFVSDISRSPNGQLAMFGLLE